MAYKVIPQVDFDKSVQKVLLLGLSRTPAENIVMSLWKASQDLNLDFKVLIEKATASGSLDVDQSILDHINLTLPNTIRYGKSVAKYAAPIITREF